MLKINSLISKIDFFISFFICAFLSYKLETKQEIMSVFIFGIISIITHYCFKFIFIKVKKMNETIYRFLSWLSLIGVFFIIILLIVNVIENIVLLIPIMFFINILFAIISVKEV